MAITMTTVISHLVNISITGFSPNYLVEPVWCQMVTGKVCEKGVSCQMPKNLAVKCTNHHVLW